MRWLVIQTNLAQCPEEPLLDVVEAENVRELKEKLAELERNDMEITAVPLAKVVTKLIAGKPVRPTMRDTCKSCGNLYLEEELLPEVEICLFCLFDIIRRILEEDLSPCETILRALTEEVHDYEGA